MSSPTKLLHILMLHNRYQYAGGEDTSTKSDVMLLQQGGHRVTFIEKHNDEIKNFSRIKLSKLFFHAAWNPEIYRWMRSHLQELHPDLLHVQNFFPLFSPSVHTAARSLQIPSIQHLHNFRMGCLNAYLFRQGKVCEKCVGCNPWRGVVYRCYRNSLPASVSVWNMITYNRWRKTWIEDVDAFIAPSQFAANKLAEIGVDSERLYVKPNVTEDPLKGQPISSLPQQPKFLYVGRLSPEKGVMTLLRAWDKLTEPEWQLEIIGDGEQRRELEKFVSDRQLNNVNFQGYQPSDRVWEAIFKATAIVVPSQCYETFGRVVIEAFACGRGVLVSDLGALPELVTEGKTGFLVPASDIDAWTERLYWSGSHLLEMTSIGKQCRQVYLQLYTPTVNYQKIMEIYCRVLKKSLSVAHES